MISSDSSVPEKASTTLLVCTHKRGVGLALLAHSTQSEVLNRAASEFLNCATIEPLPLHLQGSVAPAYFYESPSSIYAICSGLTAENLSSLYAGVLSQRNTTDAQVNTVAVVVGPGSFTGLRLGCAFANGLMLGRRRVLVAVGLDENAGAAGAFAPSVWAGFAGQPSADADDPYATSVSFADLHGALCAWANGRGQLVDVLEPHYGRDPTPVIKLRQQQEGNQS